MEEATPQDPRAGWTRRTFAALESPAYRRFFVGKGVSLVGTWARQTALGWLVYDLTGSKLLLGTVGLAAYLPLAVLAPVAGVVADRADRRRLLLWLNAGLMACACALTALVATGAVRPSHVLFFSAATGVLVAFELPAQQAFVSDLVERPMLRNALALKSATFNLTMLLGPAAAALLLPVGGMTAVFAFDAATYVAVLAALGGMRLPRAARTPPSEEGAWADLTAGARYAAREPVVRGLLGLLAVAMAFGWSYSALLPAFGKDVLATGVSGYALLYASSGVGAFLGALVVAGSRGRRPDRAVVAFLLGVSVSLIGFSVARSLSVACALRALAGFSMIGFLSTANTTIQGMVPDALRGRLTSVWVFVWSLSFPLGQQAMGAAAERLGTPAAIGAGGAVCLTAMLALLLLRAGRGGRTARAAA